MKKLLSIVVPMYNEEKMVDLFLKTLTTDLKDLNYDLEIIAVNDGSKDQTLNLLIKAQEIYPQLVIVNLSRNFGHEGAIAAGLSVTKGDIIVPLDADLQDPPSLIPTLIEKYEEGYEVINAKRKSRAGESAFKKGTANLFYKVIGKFSNKVKVPNNVGHFRLISRRVLDEVIKLNDYVRVFRAEVPYVGFLTTTIEFERPLRKEGKTHYNVKMMTDLAIDSIVSTSIEPLKLMTKFTIIYGLIYLLSVISLIILFGVDKGLDLTLITNTHYLIWLIAEIMGLFFLIICFFFALIAEYLGRTFLEAQKRPFFIIDKIIKK